MPSLTRTMLVLGCGLMVAGAAGAQEMPNPQQMQMQVQNIVRDRPREAEAAARAFLHVIGMKESGLDSLRARSLDEYWMEVGQLTVQFEMVQQLARRDSVRADLVSRMFGLEVNARSAQRAYRGASEPQRGALRKRLEGLIDQHFDIENQLRGLEIADIERRLSQVRAETERRREKRAELVKWAVDDIIRDATRPQ
jgi:hypothetical protein